MVSLVWAFSVAVAALLLSGLLVVLALGVVFFAVDLRGVEAFFALVAGVVFRVLAFAVVFFAALAVVRFLAGAFFTGFFLPVFAVSLLSSLMGFSILH